MPEISRFFGLVIAMFYNDHLPPHFHVRYGEQQAIIGLDPPSLLEGKLGPRATGLAIEWALLNVDQLRANWERARRHEELQSIPPLE